MDQSRLAVMRMRRRRNQTSASGLPSLSGPGGGGGGDGSAAASPVGTAPNLTRFSSAPVGAATSSMLKQSALVTGNNDDELDAGDDVFAVNPTYGTVLLGIKLPKSHSADILHPNMSLMYSSGWKNGPFGLGWQVGIPTVTRSTKIQVPTYRGDNDSYVLAGLDLLPREKAVRSEEGYSVKEYFLQGPMENELRVERWTSNANVDEVFWKTISSNSKIGFYGKEESSRVFEKSGVKSNVFSWLLCESYDADGDAIAYSYKAENNDGLENLPVNQRYLESCKTAHITAQTRYIKRIMYGNKEKCWDKQASRIKPVSKDTAWSFSIVFDYGEHSAEKPTLKEDARWKFRKDRFSSGRAGYEIRTHRLCRRVLMFQHFHGEHGKDDLLVESTTLTYEESPSGSILQAITHCKHNFDEKAQVYSSSSLSKLELNYETLVPVEELKLESTRPVCLQNIDLSYSDAMTQWVDLDGEGSPGLLVQMDGTWYYQRNENALMASGLESGETPWRFDFGPERELPSIPAIKDYTRMWLEDIDCTGRPDVVMADAGGHIIGFHERLKATDSWSHLQIIDSGPSMICSHEAVQLDLTGNGLPDVLIPGESPGELDWHPALGRHGFDVRQSCQLVQDRETSIARLLGDAYTSIFIADMTGDGLQDIVYISSGRVAYLANLGHGRFAREVAMSNAPILCDDEGNFNPESLQLADVDGTGTTDIIHLPPLGGATIFFNQCGNSFSAGIHIPQFPRSDHTSTVFTLDLLGKGTACLCWVGPEDTHTEKLILRYIDLAPRGKTNLLTSYSNHQGKETVISYVPSTAFYQFDEQHGQKWTHPVPFSTPLVRQVITHDEKADSIHKTTYSYHEGFYDASKREFCGFGTVDTWEAKQTISAKNEAVQHTKSWYHTGAPGAPSVPATTFKGQLVRSEVVGKS